MERRRAYKCQEDDITIDPVAPHTATLVWLHGLGDSATGFLPYFTDPSLVFPSLKVILLTASANAVSINDGMVMNSWYDIKSLEECSEVGDGADESARRISAVLAQEAQLTSNVFIGGISQGGAMALYLAYSAFPGIVKGVVALSCYCFPLEITEERKRIPGLIMHGDEDYMIALDFARSTYERTLTGVNFSFKVVRGLEHWVNEEEMVEVKEWIRQLSQSA